MISRRDFIRDYCLKNSIGEDDLLEVFAVLRCYCGFGRCPGWVMILKDKEHMDFHKKNFGRPE